MSLPPEDELDAMTDLIAPGYVFKSLPPEQKVQVINLVQQSRIDGWLADISNWFEKSKLWEGRIT